MTGYFVWCLPAGMLTDMCSFLRSLSWLDNIEFRKRARVPILALVHRSHVEVDIRCGAVGCGDISSLSISCAVLG